MPRDSMFFHITLTSSRSNTTKVHDHWTTMYNVQCIISAPFWHVHFTSNDHLIKRTFFHISCVLIVRWSPLSFYCRAEYPESVLIAGPLDDQWSLALEGTIDHISGSHWWRKVCPPSRPPSFLLKQKTSFVELTTIRRSC